MDKDILNNCSNCLGKASNIGCEGHEYENQASLFLVTYSHWDCVFVSNSIFILCYRVKNLLLFIIDIYDKMITDFRVFKHMHAFLQLYFKYSIKKK